MKTLLLVSCDFAITRRNYIIMKTVSLHLTYTNRNKLKESDVKEVSFFTISLCQRTSFRCKRGNILRQAVII